VRCLPLVVLLTAACGSAAHVPAAQSAVSVTAPVTAPATTGPATTAPATSAPATSLPAATSPAAAPPAARPPATSPPQPAADRPVIVIDPGHSPAIRSTDPATGLDDSDYENEPEMQDVFAVATLVRQRLEADGYRVVLTKATATTRVSLGQRAAIANTAHAALAISIHDQAGTNGGIGFQQGNNIVYYQAVGDYRQNSSGRRITFSDSSVAATSQRFASIFQSARAAAEGHHVTVQGNVGYDLGTRGLAPGNIWIVQLLSTVPWIYNEAGGNSTGRSGLDAADEQRYADGLVAGVERSVPARR
jgi:N-acetylmuramoyl-L-alanine amidase